MGTRRVYCVVLHKEVAEVWRSGVFGLSAK